MSVHVSVVSTTTCFHSLDVLVDVELLYLSAIKKERWNNPYLASASTRYSPITGLTGVKVHSRTGKGTELYLEV